jgi:hypothetical protein
MSEETEKPATNDIEQEFAAMRNMHNALLPLSEESRLKVLRAVVILLDIDQSV